MFINKPINLKPSGTFHEIYKNGKFDLKKFQKNFDIALISNSHDTAEFSIKGIEAPIANALRRILISEVC